jgi:hypothetical protein
MPFASLFSEMEDALLAGFHGDEDPRCRNTLGEWRSGTQTGPSISAFPVNTGEIQELSAQDTDIIGINFSIGENNRKIQDLEFSKSGAPSEDKCLRKRPFGKDIRFQADAFKITRALYITMKRMSSIKMML